MLSWPVTLNIQTRVCTQIILLCWKSVPLEKDYALKTKFPNTFSFSYEPVTLPLNLYILSTGNVALLHSNMEIDRRVQS